MRLWHIDLIEYLPRRQLTGLWRDVCQVARNLAVSGTSGHILASRVEDYPLEDLYAYAHEVWDRMIDRGYHTSFREFQRWQQLPEGTELPDRPFKNWHTRRYLLQNLYALQELFDSRGISVEEWTEIEEILAEVQMEEGV